MPVSRYDDTLLFLARVIFQSYNSPSSRKSKLTFDNTILTYKPEKSNNLYCHYENDDMILVGIHGADDIRLNITAIGVFLSENILLSAVRDICSKYDELIKEDKPVFIAAHSLGAYSVVECSLRHSKKIKSFLYAPYTPRTFGRVHTEIRQATHFKKILYSNDWLARNMLQGKNPLRDTLVFQPSIKNFINTHGISTYLKNPNIVNRDFKLYKQ